MRPIVIWSRQVTSNALQVTSNALQVTSNALQVTSNALQVTSNALQVTSNALQVTSNALPVTSNALQVTSNALLVPEQEYYQISLSGLKFRLLYHVKPEHLITFFLVIVQARGCIVVKVESKLPFTILSRQNISISENIQVSSYIAAT